MHGGYNLFFVDYTRISRPPCYVSLVNNVQFISKCIGHYLNKLRRNGLHVQQLTCVGHSLGATICGVLKRYLQFQLNKIIGICVLTNTFTKISTSFHVIGLDPARPLIFGNFRLSRTDARFVHVLQTNAGYYGGVGSMGHVNVCVNGGLIQPYCSRTSSMLYNY